MVGLLKNFFALRVRSFFLALPSFKSYLRPWAQRHRLGGGGGGAFAPLIFQQKFFLAILK